MTKEERRYYTDLIKGRLSKKRFEHSVNVSRQAVHLAKLYGADEDKAELAGLLHDIMKEETGESQLCYIRARMRRPSDALLAVPKVWHGFAGAGYLKKELRINDKEILDAVAYHSTGRVNMTLLDKIIYLADYTSAERDYNGADEMKKIVEHSLDKAMLKALGYTLESTSRARRPVHPDTFYAYNEYAIKLAESAKK